MRIGGNACTWLLTGCVLAAAGSTYAIDNQESPYKSIVVRNAFALRPPPQVEVKEEAPKDVPRITLTGMTDILGLKQVVLKAELPARQGQTAKEQSYLLGVGDRQDGIEVVSIDETAGSVKLNVEGVEGSLTLDFQHNGPKPPSGGTGPVPAMMAANTGFPPGHRFPGMPAPPGQVAQTIPGVSYSPPPVNPAIDNSGGLNANPQMAQNAPAVGPQPTGLNWAGNGGQKPVDPNEPAVAQYNPGVTSEEQAILIEAQRAQMIEQGSDMATMLPTTQFTDEVTKSITPPQPPKGF